MSTPFLVSLDPSSSASSAPSLTLKQISYFGRVLIKATDVSQAEDFIRQNFRLLDVYVDATAIPTVGDIVDVLNAGAAKVFISLTQLAALSQEQNVPPSRLAVYATFETEIEILRAWVAGNAERKDVGVCTQLQDVKALATTLGQDLEAQNVFQLLSKNAVTEDAALKAVEQGAVVVLPAETLSLERNPDGKISPAKLLSTRAVADANTGLYATSVTDERGTCLGLVWSSDESIAEALKTGTGVYQSRKRGLWYKGQSSGDVQELIRVAFDCDSDCLLFVVNQVGRGEKNYHIYGITQWRCQDLRIGSRILPSRSSQLLR